MQQINFLFSSIISFILLLGSGCAFNNAEVKRPDLIDKSKKMYIYGYNDEANIKSTVKKNLLKLGFDVVDDKGIAALIVDYNYNCRWDVIHYTCRRFNMFVTDAMSNEIVLQSKFWAETLFSANHLIDNMFNELEKELDKTLSQKQATLPSQRAPQNNIR